MLKERRGLSEIVANREANRVYLAVDDVQADLTNRLAGDGLQIQDYKEELEHFTKLTYYYLGQNY